MVILNSLKAEASDLISLIYNVESVHRMLTTIFILDMKLN